MATTATENSSAPKRVYAGPTLTQHGRLALLTAAGASPPEPVSDRRLKRDIELLATIDNGIRLHRYRYFWSDRLWVGVIAQEVAGIVPEAVLTGADGLMRVDYARLGLRLQTWEEWAEASAGNRLAA